jgi:hypothetical protein
MPPVRVFMPPARAWSPARRLNPFDSPNQACDHESRVSAGGERTAQSSSRLDEERSWHQLKYCKSVLGSTSTMPPRRTAGWPSAGAAVLRPTVRRGVTSRTNDEWNGRCNGLRRSREAVESTGRGIGATPDLPAWQDTRQRALGSRSTARRAAPGCTGFDGRPLLGLRPLVLRRRCGGRLCRERC